MRASGEGEVEHLFRDELQRFAGKVECAQEDLCAVCAPRNGCVYKEVLCSEERLGRLR